MKNKAEYALESMYYILSDEEYEQIEDGSEEEIFKKILKYWEKHDPTPHTPFNEAMAEYFARVDFSFFNFQTVTAEDGSKTDRGKIYILFGPPSNKEIKLANNVSLEIWTYESLNKQYFFEQTSTGIYKLIKIK
jgi:GWxTD domain-containing protein